MARGIIAARTIRSVAALSVPVLLVLLCPAQPNLQIQTREIHRPGKFFGIFFKYPEIPGANAFNSAVLGIINPVIQHVQNEMSEMSTPSGQIPNGAGGYINGNYTATVLKNGVVTVLIDWSEYYPGAAHPGGNSASVNYDSRAGRVLALADFFRPGVDYVSELSRLAIADLDKNEFADHYAIRHGAGPAGANFRVFTVTESDLVLHFQTYQVAAGAMGPVDVAIPLTELRPILRKRWIPASTPDQVQPTH